MVIKLKKELLYACKYSIINWYCKMNMTISCGTQWVKTFQLRKFMIITHLPCVHFLSMKTISIAD